MECEIFGRDKWKNKAKCRKIVIFPGNFSEHSILYQIQPPQISKAPIK